MFCVHFRDKDTFEEAKFQGDPHCITTMQSIYSAKLLIEKHLRSEKLTNDSSRKRLHFARVYDVLEAFCLLIQSLKNASSEEDCFRWYLTCVFITFSVSFLIFASLHSAKSILKHLHNLH